MAAAGGSVGQTGLDFDAPAYGIMGGFSVAAGRPVRERRRGESGDKSGGQCGGEEKGDGGDEGTGEGSDEDGEGKRAQGAPPCEHPRG